MPIIITDAAVAGTSIQSGFNKRYVYLISAVAALGGLLFGFDLVIISGTVTSFTKYFSLSDVQTGWAVGCINIGAALGAIAAGKLGELLGRKKLLMICAVLFAVTGPGTGWADNFNLFIAFRILSGVAVGTAALVCPVYVAEISPAAIRGRMVSLYQLSIVVGILVAYLSNYLLLHAGPDNWRWMFSSQSVPSLLFFIGLFFVAESPRWLIRKQRKSEAMTILKRIGGERYASTEAEQIAQSFSNASQASITDLIKKDAWPIVLTGIVVAVFSQAVGQNSLFSYAPVIFRQAGMPEDSAFLQSVILGLVNFVFTFIAIFRIDKAGRRTLLLYGAALLCLDAIALAACFYFNAPGYWTLIFVLGFIAVYAATLGPVTWVLLSEIFPNRLRGLAMSVATLSLWIANFFTTASFPWLQAHIGLHNTFAMHAAICMMYLFFIIRRVPETKNKSLEELEKIIVGTSAS